MHVEPLRHLSLVPLLGLAAALLHGACSAESGAGPLPSPADRGGAGGGGIDLDGGIVGDAPLDPDAACALVTEEAVAVPLNLYILMDASSSMATDNKWNRAKAGLDAFVHNARFAGVRVALRFFPRTPDDVPACDPSAYKAPLVPFGPLPDNAAAIVSALDAASPSGFDTPIYPALGGALHRAIEVAKERPGEAAAVLLVTDGEPQGPAAECSGVNPEDPAVIAQLAENGANYRPSVRTFVIGLPGANQSIANQIAAAGGTDSAVLVAATNLEVEFETALAKVTGGALPCDYEVPARVEGGEIAFSDVNVLFAVNGAEVEILPQDPDCDGPGWRYDDPRKPTRLTLCGETCEAARDAASAQIQILLGCRTVLR